MKKTQNLGMYKCKAGTGCSYAGGYAINDGNWHHIVGEFTANNTYNMWVDTTQRLTNFQGGYADAITNGSYWILGAAIGDLAYCYLYSKLLDSTERATLYNSGVPI